jgi:hypothetical protein
MSMGEKSWVAQWGVWKEISDLVRNMGQKHGI